MLPNTVGEMPNLPQIKPEFKTAQVHSDNKNTTLISLGRLYNDNCLALTDKCKMVVYKDNEPVLRATWCNKTGMHLVNLSSLKQLVNSARTLKAAKIAQMHHFTLISRILF